MVTAFQQHVRNIGVRSISILYFAGGAEPLVDICTPPDAVMESGWEGLGSDGKLYEGVPCMSTHR